MKPPLLQPRVACCGRNLAAGVLLTAVLTACGGARASSPAPIELRDLPLLFADDAALADQRGVVRTIHAARTLPAPVIEPDRPWEGDRVYTYGTLFHDEANGRFVLWYMSRTQRPGGTSAAPTLRSGGMDVVLWATSRDGRSWEKPALGRHAYDGSTANNIVADVHSPAVVVDRFERDPAKRYKLLGYHKGGYHAYHSADGQRWLPYPKDPVFTGSDTMSMTQDPRTGEFLVYFKKPSAEVPGRLVWLTRSRDFQSWSEPKLVFHPDAEDHAWARGPDQRMEVYNMAVLPHAGGFLGLPTMFRVTWRAPKGMKLPSSQSSNDGPIDVHLVTSTDGEKWHRTWPRMPVIPRGAPGTFDGGTILGVTSTRIDAGDETWLLYTAINTGHGGAIPPKRITVGRATWRLHGFASLDASPAGGRIETRPLLVPSGTLLVNADASRGRLRVALLEADGRPIPGCGLEDSVPLTTDATRAAVRWRGGTLPKDRAVRVVVEMSGTRLFSLAAER
ncbi:MAG: hypothetical protein HZC55_02330 [Verrucomicrobia bacterium]|nr:hypothetical protein [Verrucomicrobiota bacterium]